MDSISISSPITLPCGAILKNRIAKSAMSEDMASQDHLANSKFETLYRRWALGGTGLLITGNIMIDSSALGESKNVVIEKGMDHQSLSSWAKAGAIEGTHLWAQLNHPGKQSPRFLSKEPVSPSAIELKAPLNRFFNKPRALTEVEINDIIERFAYAALVVKNSGFTGVQIHGAHGYLISQFLSPLHNQRTDKWGGSFDNRMRFVVEVYQAIRRSVGKEFPVGIKLNSADFQRGGFSSEESMQVVDSLSTMGIDLIEISGGTYESPEMTGSKRKKTTQEREAYFLEYAQSVRKFSKTPLMLTGGFRSLVGMNSALKERACDVVGLARSLALDPDFSNSLLSSIPAVSQVHPISTGIRALDELFPLEITWYTHQIHRLGAGKKPNPKLSAYRAIFSTLYEIGIHGLKRVRA